MESGVRMLLNDMKRALDRGVKIRILTGNYLGITLLDSVQQARCVSVHDANEIRNKLLNLTSQRGRSRLISSSHF